MKIPRLDDPRDPRPGPGWIAVGNTDGAPLKPLVRCNCGTLIGIAAHSVAADGTVTASFFHDKGCDPARGCDWHEFITLDGYDGPAFGPGEGR
jgi:hypothetical protein